jgi:hypothetical protein
MVPNLTGMSQGDATIYMYNMSWYYTTYQSYNNKQVTTWPFSILSMWRFKTLLSKMLIWQLDLISEGKFQSAVQITTQAYKKTPWPQSASEQYRPTDRPLSAKLVPTLADRGCRVVGAMDLYGRILCFLAPQFNSGGLVDHISDPLFHRKSGSAGNRTRISGPAARKSDN